MTKQEQAVLRLAIGWWRGHRPLSFRLKDHLENPTINLSFGREKRLAKAVAKMTERKKPS